METSHGLIKVPNNRLVLRLWGLGLCVCLSLSLKLEIFIFRVDTRIFISWTVWRAFGVVVVTEGQMGGDWKRRVKVEGGLRAPLLTPWLMPSRL